MEDDSVILVMRCFAFNTERLILSVQRASTDNHNPGLWEVPGGKAEKGQDFYEELKREVEEETGFVIRIIDNETHSQSKLVGPGSRHSGKTHVVTFVVAEIIGGELKLSHEHDDLRMCSYEDFMELDLTQESKIAAIALKDRLVEMVVS